MPDLPRLIAFDADDLAVIAANLQDALIRVGDMAYLPRSKQFAMVAARFDWVGAAARKTGSSCCERCRTGLHFGRVLKVSCLGFHHQDEALILNLLDIGFKETAPQFDRKLLDYAISNLSVRRSKNQRASLAKV